jgi:hypothetical protein
MLQSDALHIPSRAINNKKDVNQSPII